MNIARPSLKWAQPLAKRLRTEAIILHHAEAENATVQDIHRWHLKRGWAGIGYHYYIRKDGSVYQGRPEDTVGAHAGSQSGYNSKSIGICFEGNYMAESMPHAQFTAGIELISLIQKRYQGVLTILGHRDVCNTDCPGKNFPMAQLKNYKDAEEIEMTTEQLKRIIQQEIEAANVKKAIEPPETWAAQVWAKAEQAGIMDGSRPQSPVLRQELAAVLERIGALK